MVGVPGFCDDEACVDVAKGRRKMGKTKSLISLGVSGLLARGAKQGRRKRATGCARG